MARNLQDNQKYTLAAHQSHQSHGSHRSHRSHQSSSYRLQPINDGGDLARNEQSTPNTSILPSSQAVAKKIKTLPGNSHKFKSAIQRLQTALLLQGYEVGVVDGNMHASTVAAIYEYQKRHGYIADGKATNEVLASLSIDIQ